MTAPVQIEVRTAGPKDWRLMQQIQVDGQLFASDGFHPIGTGGVPGEFHWLVALAGQKPIGFSAWGVALGVAEIRWMGVLGSQPAAVGAALCEAVARAAAGEASKISVTYPAGQAEAEFWAGLGFSPVTSGPVAREDAGLIVAERRLRAGGLRP